jgi:hypothetical protein
MLALAWPTIRRLIRTSGDFTSAAAEIPTIDSRCIAASSGVDLSNISPRDWYENAARTAGLNSNLNWVSGPYWNPTALSLTKEESAALLELITPVASAWNAANQRWNDATWNEFVRLRSKGYATDEWDRGAPPPPLRTTDPDQAIIVSHGAHRISRTVMTSAQFPSLAELKRHANTLSRELHDMVIAFYADRALQKSQLPEGLHAS